MSRIYHKPAKLIKNLGFKVPGEPKLTTSKPGKAVKVDSHATEFGKYVLWASSKKYAVLTAEELNNYIQFDE